jgi:hypothetical protein
MWNDMRKKNRIMAGAAGVTRPERLGGRGRAYADDHVKPE